MARERSANIAGNLITETLNVATLNVTTIVLSSGQDVSTTANDAYIQANAARDQANTAYGQANLAYTQANAARDQANTARSDANTTFGTLNTSAATQNTWINNLNTATGTINSHLGTINTTFATVNTAVTNAHNQANAAYTEANLKLNITGGTINGSLNVSGNLTITGNTKYVNVDTYIVTDPLIYLAANNDTSDLVDIGFMGGHNTAGVYQHSGLARDAGDGTWYLFTGLADEGHENNVVDFANTTLATLRANINANSILLTGNSVATQANLTLAHNQANSAFDAANNRVLKAGDTMTGLLNVANSLVVTGNVGIGTSLPDKKLVIAASNAAVGENNTLKFLNNNVTIAAGEQIGKIEFVENDGGVETVSAYIQTLSENTAGAGALLLGTGVAAGQAPSERLRITSDGNVGIGTTSPITKLQVNGDITIPAGSNRGRIGGSITAIDFTFTNADGSLVSPNKMELALISDYTSSRAQLKIGRSHTNSYPSYAFIDDTNTGIVGGINADEMGFVTGGTERLVLNATEAVFNESGADVDFRIESDTSTHALFVRGSDGNVGIGTTSPSEKLHVAGQLIVDGGTGVASTGVLHVRQNGDTLNNGIAITSSNATSHRIWKDANGTLNFGPTNLPSSFVQDLSGNIGIGTNDPQTFLHLQSNVLNIRLTDSDTGAYSNMATLNNGSLQFSADLGNSQSGTYIQFLIDAAEKMRITSDGNVGIGTSVPAGTLHIYATPTSGYVRIGGGNGSGNSRVFIESNGDNSYIDSYGNGAHKRLSIQANPLILNSTGGGSVRVGANIDPTTGGFTNTTLSIKQIADGNFGGGIHIESSANTNVAYFGFNGSEFRIGTSYRTTGSYQPIGFYTSGAKVLHIGTDGFVGIGTTSPSTKLHVYNSAVAGVLVRGEGANLAAHYQLQHGGGGSRTGVDGTWNMSFGSAETDFGASPNLGGGLAFWHQSSTNVINDVFRLKTDKTALFSGNVGIGTSSPNGRLEVSGGDFYFNATNVSNRYMLINQGSGGDGGFLFRRVGVSKFQQALISGDSLVFYSYGLGNYAMTISQTGNVGIAGALSKGSGSFKIDHPLPEKSNTHHLVHSFIEGPQADLIYRGKVQLIDGAATVNIDTSSGMTEGTFIALCREVQCFTTNESDWDAIRGSVQGNILTIESQNPSSNAMVSWMVIGERKDKHMYDTEWTDENGKVIVEPEKNIQVINNLQRESE